jgi:hypothetical protein
MSTSSSHIVERALNSDDENYTESGDPLHTMNAASSKSMSKAASTKKSSDGKRKAVETASTEFIKASELHEAKKVKKNSPDEEVGKKVSLYLSSL